MWHFSEQAKDVMVRLVKDGELIGQSFVSLTDAMHNNYQKVRHPSCNFLLTAVQSDLSRGWILEHGPSWWLAKPTRWPRSVK
jgi:hypothetical protein